MPLDPLPIVAGSPLVFAEAAAPTTKAQSSDWFCSENPDGTLEVNFYFGAGPDVTIPREVDGRLVTALGDNVFFAYSNLKSITIPSSVTRIGETVFFGCTGLTSITIPSSVTQIGYAAFSGCTSLSSITIESGVIAIGGRTFSGCRSLTSITIPSSVTRLGYGAFADCVGLTGVTIPASVTGTLAAFSGCTGLTAITIPSGVTDIGYEAFSGCSGLTSITIPASVTDIGYAAFSGCTGLASITIPASVTGIGYAAFSGCTGLKSVTIPSSVTRIPDQAFQYCTGLTDISIPSSVSAIGDRAFSFCRGLTSITLPSSVTYVSGEAFYGCPNLRSIAVATSNPTYTSVDGVLYTRRPELGWEQIIYPEGKTGALVIPSFMESIPLKTFLNCTRLTSITIPSSVTRIEDSAFSGCTRLTSITIPSSVTSIGNRAFSSCPGLTSITIPASVTYLAGEAFTYCTGLTRITIPASVTSIYADTFSGCSGLVSVTIPSSVTRIEDRAFASCTGLTSIAIPASVSRIVNTAFLDCTGLRAISVASSSATYASVDGVVYDKSVSTLVLCPPGRTGVLVIPASLTSDNFGPLSSGITSFVVEPANTTFTSVDGVLYNRFFELVRCPKGKAGAVVIPSSTVRILPYAFINCTGLTSIAIPSSVTELGDAAFFGCTALTSLAIPSSVTRIGDQAFQYCTGLTDIWIPSSVSELGAEAFRGCVGLKNITLSPAVKRLATELFWDCKSLTNITVPASVTHIDDAVFTGCDKLTSLYFLGKQPVFSGSPDISGLRPGRFVMYRLADQILWGSSTKDCPREVFQPFDVPAGQTLDTPLASEVSRVLKQGEGTAILRYASTHSGGTIVAAGRLVVCNKDALGVGVLDVQAGARVALKAGSETVGVTSLRLDTTSRVNLGTSRLSIGASGYDAEVIRQHIASGRIVGGAPGQAGRVTLQIEPVSGEGIVAFTPFTAPDAPAGVSCTPGNGQVTLTWAAPTSDGGAAITDYAIRYSSDGGTTWVRFVDAVSPQIGVTVTGLTNGIPYRFKVAAINAIGASRPSTPSATIAPRTVAGAPQSITGTPGNGKVTLTWATPPSDGGSPITDYAIRYSSDGGTTWVRFVDAVSPQIGVTVTGLTNGTPYRFKVSAINAVGPSRPSAISAAITPAALLVPGP
jgi:autotransporter-associated beta strand protein